jgi:hypothetical protein
MENPWEIPCKCWEIPERNGGKVAYYTEKITLGSKNLN